MGFMLCVQLANQASGGFSRYNINTDAEIKQARKMRRHDDPRVPRSAAHSCLAWASPLYA